MSNTVKEKLIERGLKYEELSAELERVKAERDKLKNQHFQDAVENLNDIQSELSSLLSSLKSRLPVNADGDNVIPDSEQWMWGINRRPEKRVVRGIDKNRDGEWLLYLMVDYGSCTDTIVKKASACHSTSESCRENGGATDGE